MNHWKSPWCWERLRAEVKEGIRGWDGWMAASMQWTWTWANSGRWWGTGRPGMLQFMWSWRVGHDWVTEQYYSTEWIYVYMYGRIYMCVYIHTHMYGLPSWLSGKESACNAGDPGSISGLGRSPGEGNGHPLQYPCLENSMDRKTVGYSSWGCKELDTTEQLTRSVSCICIHTTSSLSVHLLHDTGCFHVCAIVNSVVMNIGNHVPF